MDAPQLVGGDGGTLSPWRFDREAGDLNNMAVVHPPRQQRDPKLSFANARASDTENRDDCGGGSDGGESFVSQPRMTELSCDESLVNRAHFTVPSSSRTIDPRPLTHATHSTSCLTSIGVTNVPRRDALRATQGNFTMVRGRERGRIGDGASVCARVGVVGRVGS